MTQFSDFGLEPTILDAVRSEGYTVPTPIQLQAIAPILAGRDLLGIAQTGTGKTAAFALPMLHRLIANRKRAPRLACRTLILSPTRELASQIAEMFRTYGRNLPLRVMTVFGGVAIGPQIRQLANGVDVLVATPGRLLDHMQQRTVRLDLVETFVLDEADQMLDMGFILPIRRVVQALPAVRQNLFFSATMPNEIEKLSRDLLRDPIRVAVTPVASTVEQVDQRVIYVAMADKRRLLSSMLRDAAFARTLVFARTKHGADRVVQHLLADGVDASAIHGNKSQSQRERALQGFRDGRTRVLVATDIAARGIDVEGVTHVVNFDLPNVPESYVHRIGRTARAGAGGIAISFCGHEERGMLRDIEKLIRCRIPANDHDLGSAPPLPLRQNSHAPAPQANRPAPHAKRSPPPAANRYGPPAGQRTRPGPRGQLRHGGGGR
ncbi:MAG: DEAD/DEAH box helicase [Alphaproteobacteria bacterium]|nr:DEAD/DEAH box helicase [Alphaproteobacteria bacterium]